MSYTTTMIVPRSKYEDFHRILCASGGRYTCEPVYTGVSYIVSCELNNQFGTLWSLYLRPIKEVSCTSYPKRAVRKIKGLIKDVGIKVKGFVT